MPTPSAQSPRRRGRPAAQRDNPDADSRDLLLRTGLGVLTEKGYSPVGLDEILRAAQVSKGSFYHHFATKEAYGLAVIQAYADYFARKLSRWFDDPRLSPLQALAAFIDDVTQGMARHDCRRGCLIGNLGQEMGALPESFRAALVATFQDWQQRTAVCLQAAIDAGEMAPQADAQSLAEWFWIGWEGAVMRAKLERRVQPMHSFAQSFWRLLAPTASAPVLPPITAKEKPDVSRPVD